MINLAVLNSTRCSCCQPMEILAGPFSRRVTHLVIGERRSSLNAHLVKPSPGRTSLSTSSALKCERLLLSKRRFEFSFFSSRRTLTATFEIFRVIFRDEHINRRHHEKCKRGSNDHTANQHNPDTIPGACAGSGGKDQRRMPSHGRNGCHQYRPQTCRRRLHNRSNLFYSILLQLVGKLHNQDPVLTDQPD